MSFSEIDPYASAVLAQRWPGVPNLGDITNLGVRPDYESGSGSARDALAAPEGRLGDRVDAVVASGAASATLWTGGFPCQDLSVAGKRRGMGEGTRSGLAYTYLDLVGRHRPRFVLLENVPGLLSSHGGRDMAALLGALVELGYGVGYRMLDARYFGVPQRRRRVFILGDALGGRAGAERAAEVLSVGSRCRRHPPTGIEAGPRPTVGAVPGVDIARAVTGTSGKRHDDDTDTLIAADLHPNLRSGDHGSPGIGRDNDEDRLVIARNGYLDASLAPPLIVGGRSHGAGSSVDNTPWFLGPSPDASRDRATDGLAGRSHDRGGVAATLNSGGNSGGFRTEPGEHLVPVWVKSHNVSATDGERWTDDPREARAMNSFDGDRTTLVGGVVADSDYLPIGLDSHRYRCCGNGVVSNVSDWLGSRLREAIEATEAAA